MNQISNARRIKLERAIVRALIRHMEERGWAVGNVFDGEAHVFPKTVAQAVDACFAVDEASLRFVPIAKLQSYDEERGKFYADVLIDGLKRPCTMDAISGAIGGDWAKEKSEHGVLLVMGNGEDIISDFNYSEGDRDGFHAAMDAFDAEKVRA